MRGCRACRRRFGVRARNVKAARPRIDAYPGPVGRSQRHCFVAAGAAVAADAAVEYTDGERLRSIGCQPDMAAGCAVGSAGKTRARLGPERAAGAVADRR